MLGLAINEWIMIGVIIFVPLPFMLAVLLGASCNFSTHISTAHMMMVYPVGGFRLCNMLKFGIPFCFIMAATIVLVLWTLYL